MLTAEDLARGYSFEDQVIDGLDLQSADLGGRDFFACTFRNVKLQESRWARTTLEDCEFVDCDLTRMQPAQLGLRGVRFKGCKLMGVDWTNVSPTPDVSFEECLLRYSSFVGLSMRKTRFLRCHANEANFFDVDLTEADFSGTELAGSNFQNSNLTKADLSTSSGAFVDPAKNRVRDLRASVEMAVLLAESFGIRVSGAGGADAPRGSRRRT